MVLKGLNLARLSLTKAFAHGSAQSLVAASQSSYAAQNTPFGSLANSIAPNGWPAKSTQPQLGFNQTIVQAGPGAGPVGSAANNNSRQPAGQQQGQTAEPGAAAFLAAWNKHQLRTDEVVKKSDAEPQLEADSLGRVERPHFDTTGIVIDEEAVIFEDDLVTPPHSPMMGRRRDGTGPRLVMAGPEAAGPTGKASAADKELQLLRLSTLGRHADVPAVFDDLIAAGHRPSTASYNALLVAAIALTRSKHLVVPKALHVYTDMLQRKVRPDVRTMTVLLELLATRSLDVVAQKKALEAKQSRYGFDPTKSSFLLPADGTEYGILCEDESLAMALDVFDTTAVSIRGLGEQTYRLLLSACAKEGRIDDMIRVFSRMEERQVAARPPTYIAMIDAFSQIGDLRSAVDTYNEYKAGAVGNVAIERQDVDVYTALVRAYHACGRPDGGDKFVERLIESRAIDGISADMIDGRAVIPHLIAVGQVDAAFLRASRYHDGGVKADAMTMIARAAADVDNEATALAAFQFSASATAFGQSAAALCAMFLRIGRVDAVAPYWRFAQPALSLSESLSLTIMYALALVQAGAPTAAVSVSRAMFGRLRTNSHLPFRPAVETVDEAIETIACAVRDGPVRLDAGGRIELLRMLMDNDGLLPGVAATALTGLNGEALAAMSVDELAVVGQVQAGLLVVAGSGRTADNAVEAAVGDDGVLRLVGVVETVVGRSDRLDDRVAAVILRALEGREPGVAAHWRAYLGW